jgi:pSer/pThr/pTyr-binding forkhead associated (FHA) protein
MVDATPVSEANSMRWRAPTRTRYGRVVVQSPLAPHAATPEELKARQAAERRGEPFLVYRDEGNQQVLEPLDGRDRVTIGRRQEAEVCLSWDSGVSRLHAVLECVAGEWTVSDDGLSQNGTFMRGERLAGRRRLCDGDVLRVGRTLIAFCDPQHAQFGATSKGESLGDLVRVSAAQRRVLVALARPHFTVGDYATPASNREIAEELFLSLDAVKTHLRVLFAKFGIEDLPQNRKRMGLVERAVRLGLVTERDARPRA